jgi:hypothetical protein
VKIFSLGLVDKSDEFILANAGLWDHENEWFLSNFLVFHLFNSKKKTEYPSLDIQKVIEIGLSGLEDIHFSQMVNGISVERYENSISHYIGIRYCIIHRSLC